MGEAAVDGSFVVVPEVRQATEEEGRDDACGPVWHSETERTYGRA